MGCLVRIEDLEVEFNIDREKISAVKGVNLEIGENEILLLGGESGSGKTITALSICRILPLGAKIIKGKIFFHGKDLLRSSQKQLMQVRGKEIAYIFQEPSSFLNPVFNIQEQIAEVVRLHQNKNREESKQVAQELLELVGIEEAGDRLFLYPHNLSGGMNQRVMIAMALACKPKLLIADEPTTSLDINTESNILKLLLGLKAKLKFSILFITHNLSIAKRIADRIAIMYRGKVVEINGRDEIFNLAVHSHTRELVRAYEKIGKI